MHRIVKSGATLLLLCAMSGNALAASTSTAGCARPEDMTAIKAAAVQQKLMVAALTCNAVQAYNNFVLAYRKDLQASDRALQNFFRRLNGASGTEDYHTFKTRLANTSSIQSIGDIAGYCASAQETFATALNSAKANLAVFVSRESTSADDAFSPCQIRTAGTFLPPPADVPTPRMKPVTTVLQAQGGGLPGSK